jgi:hypothetical protein
MRAHAGKMGVEVICFQDTDGQNLFWKSVTVKGLIGFAAETARDRTCGVAAS